MATANQNDTNITVASSVDTVIFSTLKTVTYAKTVQNGNTAFNNVTEASPVAVTSNVNLSLNVTIQDFDNSTEENENEADEIHSSFNLAIIPAVAVFVFIVIICIRCCKWFRHYTKGVNKDENYYAVIVTDENKDYGQIDILSESASTACYDTVSSYTSFLKRSGNDSTLNSIRALRQEGSRNDQSMTSNSGKDFMNRLTRTDGKKNMDVKSLNSSTVEKKDEAIGSFDFRTSSTSSADTVSEQLTDSPALRRNNRFRVSFVTEKPSAKALAYESRISNSYGRNDRVMRSSLKKPSVRDVKYQDLSPSSICNTGEKVTMVDVGTQTNKSFRYSLRKSKRHVSDSDVLHERTSLELNPDLLTVPTKECQTFDNDSVKLNKDIDTPTIMHVKHSSRSQEDNSKPFHSNSTSEITKYPLDTNVQIIHDHNKPGNNHNKQGTNHNKQGTNHNKQEAEEDIEDDVFVAEDERHSGPHSDKDNKSGVNKIPVSCNSAKTCSQKQNSNERLNKMCIYSCVKCNPKSDQNVVKPFCDKTITPATKIDSVIQGNEPCETCELLHKDKHNDVYESENKETDNLLIDHKCRLTELDQQMDIERPPSSLSLESSGYAELSSTGSSSSSNSVSMPLKS